MIVTGKFGGFEKIVNRVDLLRRRDNKGTGVSAAIYDQTVKPAATVNPDPIDGGSDIAPLKCANL